MRIAALFCDYDGTLAPTEAKREDSRVSEGLERTLRGIAARAKVAIVTSKDFAFIQPRTKFARGWACAGGLEVRVGQKVVTRGNLADLGQALAVAESIKEDGLVVETKRGAGGEILGLCVDWTGGRKPTPKALAELSRAAGDGVTVTDEEGRFIDIFAQKPDKGKAVAELKRLLGVDGTVMFIGDSGEDNPAFREAEVSMGVSHGQPLTRLDCTFVVNQNDLESFLEALLGRGMDFSPRFGPVRRKGA